MSFMSGSRGGFLGGVGDLTVTGALTVAGDIAANGDLAMGVGKSITLDDGGGAAAKLPLRFRSSLTSGFYCSTVDQPSMARAAVGMFYLNASGVNSNTTHNALGSMAVTGSLIAQGAFRRQVGSAKTSTYTLLSTENHIIAGAGCAIVNTPASPSTWQDILIENQSGGAVTLTANSGQTIDGAGTCSLADNSKTYIHLANDGVTWYAGEIPPA